MAALASSTADSSPLSHPPHQCNSLALRSARPSTLRLAFRGPLPLLRASPRHLRVSAEASTSGNGSLDDLAARFGESARAAGDRAGRALEDAWLKAMKFADSQNVQGRFRETLTAANRKMEELGYETRKSAEKLNRRFRISQRAEEAVDFAKQQAQNVDQQFGLVQKFRTASSDFHRNWPSYRKRLSKFLQTPIGRTLTTLAFLWFLISGWLVRIMFLAMWVLPLAAPLLLSTAARKMIVEGACPSCKRRFIGNRNQMVVCNYCRAVVWQPRQDFSKGESDPSIIDIDIE